MQPSKTKADFILKQKMEAIPNVLVKLSARLDVQIP